MSVTISNNISTYSTIAENGFDIYASSDASNVTHQFNQIIDGNTYIYLNGHLTVNIEKNDYFEIYCEFLDIFSYGDTLSEALRMFQSDFTHLFEKIVFKENEYLSKGAIDLKNKMIDITSWMTSFD